MRYGHTGRTGLALTLCGVAIGALTAPAAAQTAPAADTADPTDIVVTAQKREERLQDVPVAITVLTSDMLISTNSNRMEDYFRSVPGLALTTRGSGENTLSIRGVTTGSSSNPTVGVVIDDVPFGSSLYSGFGNVLLPDLDPSDLQRIEVLKGPQGTLYGANSMGGLLKYVTADASTDRATGYGEADVNSVDGGSIGFGGRMSLNMPIVENTAGIRISGFWRHDPGYVDDPGQARKDVNQADAYGIKAALRLNLAPGVIFDLKGLYQRTEGDGAAQVDTNYKLQPLYGEYGQNRIKGSGVFDSRVQVYSAKLSADIGSGLSLTSITGYNVNDFGTQQEFSDSFGAYAGPGGGSKLPIHFRTRKITEELRLSQTGKLLDWVIGGFHDDEKTRGSIDYNANDFATGAIRGNLLAERDFLKFKEYAVFVDVTLHITDRFDIQAGGRYVKDKLYGSSAYTGPFAQDAMGNDPPPTVASSDTSTGTFLVAPTFRVSSNLNTYIRVSSGYRPGGPNAGVFSASVPKEVQPDRTINYEIGAKGSLLDHKLSFDISAYYIDWSKVQVTAFDAVTGQAYVSNGGKAVSKGVEGSFQARPTGGLTISGNASYNIAELKRDLPVGGGAYGLNGDKLPNAPEFSGTLSAEQQVPLSGDWKGFLGGSVSYTGKRYGGFAGSAALYRPVLPAFTTGDLRIGARDGAWAITAFVKNVGNSHGVLWAQQRSGQSTFTTTYYKNLVQPRTIGLSISRNIR